MALPNIELRDMAARTAYDFGLTDADAYAILSGVDVSGLRDEWD